MKYCHNRSKTESAMSIIGKCLLYFLVFFLVTPLVSAQSNRRIQRLFEEARHQVSLQNYVSAIEQCKQILNRDSMFLDARLLLADIYFEMNDSENELIQLEKAFEHSQTPLITRRLGEVLFSLEKYEDAAGYFEKYKGSVEPGSKAEAAISRKIESSRFAANAIRNPVEFNPERLPESVNSTADEYWPGLSIDQKTLVFTRLVKNPGQPPQEDFFMSEFGHEGWKKAQPVTDINTTENEGAQSFLPTGTCFFLLPATGLAAWEVATFITRYAKTDAGVRP
jgi:tetratricopeptide (TPR) repeat protein